MLQTEFQNKSNERRSVFDDGITFAPRAHPNMLSGINEALNKENAMFIDYRKSLQKDLYRATLKKKQSKNIKF